jgi:murein DD-endopeptidase MepM/ murein hydrolase activator NlpD
MKYGVWLKFLKTLIYLKRFFWLLGAGIAFVLAKTFGGFGRFLLFLQYKFSYYLKKSGLQRASALFFKRSALQFLAFLALFGLGFTQSKLYANKDLFLPGQKAIAFALTAPEEVVGIEEETAPTVLFATPDAAWREGVLSGEGLPALGTGFVPNQDFAAVMAGGAALSKPGIMPGVTLAGKRSQIEEYTVESGDSLSSIAYDFGVSVATILWQNNLGAKALIRPGDVLKIPPTTGVMHTVKRGDTIKKIAGLYQAKEEDIISFNRLHADGNDLKAGEVIMVPEGVKPQTGTAVAVRNRNVSQTAGVVATPPPSRAAAGASGFIWPSGAHIITQYFGYTHHAIDVAGPFATPTYAAKDGVVEKAQCGWNSGYGCEIIIDHGGGIKTLYGHSSKLLVSVGEHVEQGQTIALMGNTGNVRGITGIHLHFEVIVNGARVNPLGYVR